MADKRIKVGLAGKAGPHSVVVSTYKKREKMSEVSNLKSYSSDQTTEIVLVLDESSSIDGLQDQTIQNLNDFFDSQRKVAGEAFVTVVKFCSSVSLAVDASPIGRLEKFSHYNYSPNGSTALLDAVGMSIVNTNTRFAEMDNTRRPSKVIFVILTDGEENCSRRFTRSEIKTMIQDQETNFGWDFLYLGANQNAFSVGETMGIKPGKALSWSQTQTGMSGMFEAVSRSVSAYRDSGKPAHDQFFTEEEHNTQRNLGAAATPFSSR